jgi:hypothetical protein
MAATGKTVAPAAVAVPNVVAPGVPTLAITADSTEVPASIIIFWPALNPATAATFIFDDPAADAAERFVVVCNRKSVQLLSVSAPSGNSP